MEEEKTEMTLETKPQPKGMQAVLKVMLPSLIITAGSRRPAKSSLRMTLQRSGLKARSISKRRSSFSEITICSSLMLFSSILP